MNTIKGRTEAIFNSSSGRSVMVAFDHGTEGAISGGEDVPTMLSALSNSEADALLLTVGMSRILNGSTGITDKAGPVTCAGIDIPVFSPTVGSGEPLSYTPSPWSPKDALSAGAEMCKMLLPLGITESSVWGRSLEQIAERATQATEAGIPLMLEPAYWGPNKSAKSDRAIADASRLCVELGAHVLKIPAPQDPDVLRNIVKWSPVPVLVLGGTPRAGGDFLDEVSTWLESGAHGVVVGRNIWNRPHPIAAVDALVQLVHNNDVQAARELIDAAGEPLG